MSDTWNDFASGWDTNSDVIRYAENAFASLKQTVAIKQSRILDFGCGTGLLTEKMAPDAHYIVALDPADKMIEVLESKCLSNVTTFPTALTTSLINDNTLLKNKFDLIVASSAMAFVPNVSETLNLIKSLLDSNGVYVQWDWLNATNDSGGMGFTKEALHSHLSAAGFTHITLTTPFSINAQGNTMDVLMAVAQ
ncbi:methyltransferase domain-containing protein [Aestuariibacter sp. AA17]|uniref:Methyltransferase domain-containing protein n=1 Tax=Fluctibacter corallii TaxID=2984329 RepID=A0ABT3A650_9ALTE|nr:methyltransferase [Aestuariibacter sp. AA17]MCV2883831.1 methyltransferase domain-containing protein [Aestuariibacter sp. AA17]